jgi:hypothetical protein
MAREKAPEEMKPAISISAPGKDHLRIRRGEISNMKRVKIKRMDGGRG